MHNDATNQFLKSDLSDFDRLLSLISEAKGEFTRLHRPLGTLISPNLQLTYDDSISRPEFPVDPLSSPEVLAIVLQYFTNCINWASPGAMFNVTPPVAILPIAINVLTSILNPNLAEDRSSGSLALAERHTVEILGEIFGWESGVVGGVSCFGGKATNLYAVRTAIDQARTSMGSTFELQNAFYVVSDRGHPCQQEVAHLLGLSVANVVVIPSNQEGCLDSTLAKQEIRQRILAGQQFIGLTANAGTTMEFIVDDFQSLAEMRDAIVDEFDLPFSPPLHADAVLGWVWLFVGKVTAAVCESLGLSAATADKLRSMHARMASVTIADSAGIDFHKLGYCAYSSSFFISKIGNWPSFKGKRFGEVSPYKYTIELSRGAQGVVGALTSLLTIGASGHVKLLANLLDSVEAIRQTLEASKNFAVLHRESFGVCCVVTIALRKPFEEVHLTDHEISKINELNKEFVEFVQRKLEMGGTQLHFSYSRSYVAPGSRVRFGGIKLYPTSPFISREIAIQNAEELTRLLQEYLDTKASKTDNIPIIRLDRGVDDFHPIF